MKRRRFKRGKTCYFSDSLGVRVHQFTGSKRVCACGEMRVPEVQHKFGKLFYEANFGLTKKLAKGPLAHDTW